MVEINNPSQERATIIQYVPDLANLERQLDTQALDSRLYQERILEFCAAFAALDERLINGDDNSLVMEMPSSKFQSPCRDISVPVHTVTIGIKVTGHTWKIAIGERKDCKWEILPGSESSLEGVSPSQNYQDLVASTATFVDTSLSSLPRDILARTSSLGVSFGFPHTGLVLADNIVGVDARLNPDSEVKGFCFNGAEGQSFFRDVMTHSKVLSSLPQLKDGGDPFHLAVANDTVVLVFDRDISTQRIYADLEVNGFVNLLSEYLQQEGQDLPVADLSMILGTGFNFAQRAENCVINREIGQVVIAQDQIARKLLEIRQEFGGQLIRNGGLEHMISGAYITPNVVALLRILEDSGVLPVGKLSYLFLSYVKDINNASLISNIVSDEISLSDLNRTIKDSADRQGKSHSFHEITKWELDYLQAVSQIVMQRSVYTAALATAAGLKYVGMEGKSGIVPVEGSVFWHALVDRNGTVYGDKMFHIINAVLDSRLFPVRADEMRATLTAGATGGAI